MTNPFSSIISPEFKQLFNNAIDSLLEQNALTVPCRIKYAGQQNQTFCNNCIYDPISKLSANLYNGTGPNPFPDNGICPVCMGNGTARNDVLAISSSVLYLAVIFDSKYFINKSSKYVNIPDGMVQTICLTQYISQIRNANEMIMDTDIQGYGNYTYERAGDPEPAGLGDHRYIITMWKRK